LTPFLVELIHDWRDQRGLGPFELLHAALVAFRQLLLRQEGIGRPFENVCDDKLPAGGLHQLCRKLQRGLRAATVIESQDYFSRHCTLRFVFLT